MRPAGSDELLRSLTETARRLFGAAACSLALLSEDDSELLYTIAAGEGADDVTGMRISSALMSPDAALPCSGVARRAATEVASAHNDPRIAPDWPIERKIRPLAPVRSEAQIMQQHGSQARRARQFEKPRRDQLIGVEIGDSERTCDRGQPRELVHVRLTPCVPQAAAARRPAFP